MATKVIDAQLLQKAFIAGAYNLERNKDYINELNVFPVPDGDTGSNMSLTIMAAAREGSALENPSMGFPRRFPAVPCVEQEEIPVLSYPSFCVASARRSRARSRLQYRYLQMVSYVP